MHKKQAPYGTWESPITSELIAGSTIKLEQVQIDSENIYWLENRPTELGRCVVVQLTSSGEIRDFLADTYSVRSTVHEYGGGAYFVEKGTLYFVNHLDQGIYSQEFGASPKLILQKENVSYANGIIDRHRNKLIWVKEERCSDKTINTLVSICPVSKIETTIAQGADFYSCPTLSHDGKSLAWVSWNHPNSPWDTTSLCLRDLDDNGESLITISTENESVLQPQFAADGSLYFISDKNNWWNIYRYKKGKIEPITQMNCEFARAPWVFGMSTYAILSPSKIVGCYTENGIWKLTEIDTESKKLTPIPTTMTDISYLQSTPENSVFIAGSPIQAPAVVSLNLKNNSCEILKSSTNTIIDQKYVSLPESIVCTNSKGEQVHAFYYRPCNPKYTHMPSELPPLLVKCHGGPTAAASSILNLHIQYWTSRGFAVLDVNYSGSTGFGKDYRQRLYGQWGVADVDDVCSAALSLQQEVDKDRMAISGGSAGGFTVLCALTFKNVFRTGASYYGVSDLETLGNDTHKFESHYEVHLIGPYPAKKNLYYERSPINFSDKLLCPVIFLQGKEDKVVPAHQSEVLVNTLSKKGIPVAYLLFESEGHGFRKAETIQRTLEAELYFYLQVFNLSTTELIKPVEIQNQEALYKTTA